MRRLALAVCLLWSSTAALARPNLKVALVFDYSGKVQASTSTTAGIELASRVLKERGMDVTLVRHDSGEDAKGTLEAMRRAIAENPDIIIAEVYSSKALVAAGEAEAARRVMVTPYATAPAVTEGRRFVFRTCFSDAFMAKRLADYAFTGLGGRSALLVVDAGQLYSQELARHFSVAFAERGGRIAAEIGVLDATLDAVAVVERLAAEKADILFLPLYGTQAARIIHEMAKRGVWPLKVLGGDGWGATATFVELVLNRPPSFGLIWANQAPEHPPTPAGLAVEARYLKESGAKSMPQGATLGYDTLMVIAAAFEASGHSHDQEKLAEALRRLPPYHGLGGVTHFDGRQDPAKSVHLTRVASGREEFFLELTP